MSAYYGQRAAAVLIISGATNISAEARGYAFTPGIYTDQQESYRNENDFSLEQVYCFIGSAALIISNHFGASRIWPISASKPQANSDTAMISLLNTGVSIQMLRAIGRRAAEPPEAIKNKFARSSQLLSSRLVRRPTLVAAAIYRLSHRTDPFGG